MKESQPVDILGYLWELRKYAAWGLLVAVLAGATGMFLTRPQASASKVRALALIAVAPPNATDQAAVQRISSFYSPMIYTMARVATSEEVLTPVAAKHRTTVADLQARTVSRVVPSTMLLEIRCVGPSAAEATETVNDIASALQSEATKPAYHAGGDAFALTAIQPATVNIEPSLTQEVDAAEASGSSKSAVIRLLVVGGIATLLGVVVMTVVAFLDRRRKLGREPLQP